MEVILIPYLIITKSLITLLYTPILFNYTIAYDMQLKWGILSAGRISHDFVSAVKTLPPAEHQVVAVAARDEKSAQTFANTHAIPKFYSGYQSLFTDEEVHIVYIGKLSN